MNTEMNEETLIFYYYGDGLDDEERRAVESALASHEDLARQYRQLCTELDALADSAGEPAPAHLQARWHEAIDRAAAQEAASTATAPRRWFQIPSFALGGGLAAALVLGIAIGVTVTQRPASDLANTPMTAGTQTAAPAPGPLPANAFSRGMLLHFQDSRRQLASLSPDGNGVRSKLILELVAQNRLFERAAEHSDAPALARVLRAFEPLLLRMAEEDLSVEEKAALQAQLGFELNIMLTKLTRELSNKADTFDT